jgi:transposase InsO family protein
MGLHARSSCRRASSWTTGPEFAGRTLDAWAYTHGVTLRFIRPGKPIENAYVESFNGKFRDECLNEHWFISVADAKAVIEAWRVDYNGVRPHSSSTGPRRMFLEKELSASHVSASGGSSGLRVREKRDRRAWAGTPGD